ncbi:MAG: NAD+ synthase [Chloroflexi bacterium]|nr:NAD+ synthase [Chloroflexota bacterium]MCY3581629.1 NAD+ synthase [Chloroflexota bacterium]MCY3717025.1 NAD+ synthase [Chloroflexota bacterium]MDE2652154.1 NAD+ synthase [Chloroflexota bacterium]MXV92088.1 NAD+ synthase [Chloroflexota bacterium]
MTNDTAASLLPRLRINPALATRILTGFIRDSVTKAGMKRAVIGLSGGIDSAVSAYLAAGALGAEQVLALRMPYKTSSADSLEHAEAVIEDLCLPSLTLPISAMADPLIERFPEMSRLRRGNIMARLRMITLYDQSMAWSGLVMGTSNKTEFLLGYSTIYGDSGVALHPIADLYKAQVRQLARHLGIPEAIINKAPSADLWAGQTDEDELGFTYDQADAVLYLLVDERYTVDEVAAEGFPRDFVLQIWERVKANHYKRTMPNIAKLSKRSIGHDFLYLRDYTGRAGRV